MTKYIQHIAIYLFVVLPLRILGIIYVIPVTYFYKIGQFPRYAVWFDDYRGRRLEEVAEEYRNAYCVETFGRAHCILYYSYNKTWLGRYIWVAWRNTTNYLKVQVLGRRSDIWEYSRIDDNMIKIPFIKVYLRIRIGYKIDKASIDMPFEYAFSIGVRL